MKEFISNFNFNNLKNEDSANKSLKIKADEKNEQEPNSKKSINLKYSQTKAMTPKISQKAQLLIKQSFKQNTNALNKTINDICDDNHSPSLKNFGKFCHLNNNKRQDLNKDKNTKLKGKINKLDDKNLKKTQEKLNNADQNKDNIIKEEYKMPANVTDRLYNKGIEKKAEKERRSNEMKKLKEEKELLDATFKPEINKYYKFLVF